MKEITVENFNHSNVKEWIAGYSHKEKVEFAVYCAELVIDLYTGVSDAPKKATQAAKDWILNPSEENKNKCKDAAYAAAYAADAAYAAYAAAYAADAADAAAYADDGKTVKGKIIDYILKKSTPQTKGVEWENGLPPVGEGCEQIFNGKSKIITPLYYDDHTSGMIMFYHCDSDAGIQSEYDWCLVENCIFRKPETPEAKKEREELESAYRLYCEWHELLGSGRAKPIESFNEDDDYAIFRFFIARQSNLV